MNRLDNLNLWLKTSGFDHESNELERILKESLDGSGLGSRGFQGQTVSRVNAPGSASDMADWGQAALAAIGLIPGAGEGFDAVNSAISLARGKPVEAILNAISVIPLIGDALGKGTIVLLRAIKSAKTAIKWGATTYTIGGLGIFLKEQMDKAPEQEIRSVLNVMDKKLNVAEGTMYSKYTTEIKGAVNNAASQHSPAAAGAATSSLRHDGQYESVA